MMRTRAGARVLAAVFTGVLTAALTTAVLGTAPAAAQPDRTPVGGVPGVPVPELAWTDCGDGFRCATAPVPLDYDEPAGPTIDLALIRLPASDPEQRRGSVFVNFGGPGGGRAEPGAIADTYYDDALRAGVT